MFGFGIEHALLNAVKKAGAWGDQKIIGHYKETQFNEPGRLSFIRRAGCSGTAQAGWGPLER